VYKLYKYKYKNKLYSVVNLSLDTWQCTLDNSSFISAPIFLNRSAVTSKVAKFCNYAVFNYAQCFPAQSPCLVVDNATCL